MLRFWEKKGISTCIFLVDARKVNPIFEENDLASLRAKEQPEIKMQLT